MSDDDPKRLLPEPSTDGSFESLAAARPSLADPCGELSPKLLGRIWRASAAQRKWDDDPANKDERDFWWDVGARYFKLKMKADELKVVPAVGAQAVAARNHEQRLIKAERIALKEDEREVRSAAPTELRVMIEQVRRRWDKRDSIAAGLIAAEQVQGLAEQSQAPTGVSAQTAAGSGKVGRPNAKNTSIELFKARRAAEEPLCEKQIREAKAILQQWPSSGPSKPRPATVSQHISSVWQKAQSTD